MFRTLPALTIWLLVVMLLLAGHDFRTAQAQTDRVCFVDATNLCIEGRIREYWEQNGGLPVFGYPITPQRTEIIEGREVSVQWFERNRLELHPTNERPNDVLLGRVGAEVLAAQDIVWQTAYLNEAPQSGCLYFEQTQKNICGDILAAWQANGLDLGEPGISQAESLALFGLPLSPLQQEEVGGQSLQVQWFERARFELHPTNEPPFQVQLGLLGSEANMAADPGSVQVAPERLVFTSQLRGNQDVYSCDIKPERNGCVDGSTTRLTNIDSNDGQPTWSPDATQIAFESNVDNNWDVYLLQSSGPVRLTTSPAIDGAPSWGNIPGLGWRIAFHSNRRDGGFDLFMAWPPDADNETQAVNVIGLTNAPNNERHPAISPDGRRIAYAANPDGGDTGIYVADLVVDNESVSLFNPRLITEGLDGASIKPAWSPDGSRLLFENDGTGNADIYLVNADGSGEIRNLTMHEASDGHPTWSPDGERLAFQSNRDTGVSAIYVMRVDSPDAFLMVAQPSTDVLHPSWQW